MVNNKNLIIAGCVLIAGIIAFFVFYDSEEDKIKKQFYFIAETIGKEPGESQIIAAAKSKKLRGVITDPCTVEAPDYSLARQLSSGDFATYALVRRTRFSEIHLEFNDIRIEFPEEKTARVNVTASMRGTMTSGESVEDIHELDCTLNKIQDVWLLSYIYVVEVLEK